MNQLQLVIQASGYQKGYQKIKHTEHIPKEVCSARLTKEDLKNTFLTLIQSISNLRLSCTKLSFEVNYIDDTKQVKQFKEMEVIHQAMDYTSLQSLLKKYRRITSFNDFKNYMLFFK